MFYDKIVLGVDYSASCAPLEDIQDVIGLLGTPVALAHALGPIEAGKGTFFAKQIDMREPEGTAFTARILALYDDAKPRGKAWKKDDLATHSTRVRKLLANAIRAYFYRKTPAVLYFTGAASKHYKNEPSWMRHGALGDVTAILEKAGLMTRITGKAMPAYSKQKSTASAYAATQKLIDIAEEGGVSAGSICTDYKPEWRVQLFGPKPKPVYDFNKGGLIHARKGELIPFTPSNQEQEWIDSIGAINAFYRQQDIALGSSPLDTRRLLKKQNANPERSGAEYRRPERFQTDLYRVFNDGDPVSLTFAKGGRLYGPWWMSEPEEARKEITISGQRTAEHDYAECHARMLYHIEGIDNKEPLYAVPEVTAYEQQAGLKEGTFRPCIKWLFQVLTNGKGRPDQADMPDNVVTPPGFTIKQLVGFIEVKHQPIAHKFKTGAGLDLMRIESDIALEIIKTAMLEGWVVLSIHDSFITTVDKEDRLKKLMVQSYGKRFFGFEPMFKNK